MMTFDFPVGYHTFNPVTIINFQLNRWYSLGYARLEDMKSAGEQIRTFDDWKRVMTGLAEKAVSEERWINAAFYFRAAEFFVLAGSTRTRKCSMTGFPISSTTRPLPASRLSGMPSRMKERTSRPSHIPPVQDPEKGTIVIHGGFDSFIEEWYSCATFFAARGIRHHHVRRAGTGSGAEKGWPAVNA